MQALLDAGLPVSAVISNDAHASGLTIARQRGVAAAVVEHRAHSSREDFDAALRQAIDRHAPRVIALAGFMRILTAQFVSHYGDSLLNIHPSLLPAFPGLDTHARALAAGVKVHGCTVHFVTPELDGGPVVIQATVPVRPGDSAQALAARVLKQEHIVYPRAVRWCLDGRLVVENGVVRVRDATALDAQLVISAD